MKGIKKQLDSVFRASKLYFIGGKVWFGTRCTHITLRTLLPPRPMLVVRVRPWVAKARTIDSMLRSSPSAMDRKSLEDSRRVSSGESAKYEQNETKLDYKDLCSTYNCSTYGEERVTPSIFRQPIQDAAVARDTLYLLVNALA